MNDPATHLVLEVLLRRHRRHGSRTDTACVAGSEPTTVKQVTDGGQDVPSSGPL
jgi:hypothetical protein